LYHLFNGKHKLVILRENIRLKWKTMKNIASISISGMGQFLIDSVAWIVLMRITAEFGDDAVAGTTIAMRILMFSLMPAWGFSAAAATLVGQYMGAEKLKRATLSVLLTVRYNVLFLGCITAVYLIFGDQIVSAFTDNSIVAEIASSGLRVIVLGYVFFAVGMVMIQAFNGAGDTKTPMFINVFVFMILEIPLAYFLAITADLGVMGIFITIAFCHSLHALIAMYYFRKGLWKTVRV